MPTFNGTTLTIATIIKLVMSSEAESDLVALFITAKAIFPLLQTLIDMGWPQPPSPIQTENSTAVGVVNKTISPQRIISMEMCFHLLRFQNSQGQFRFYWGPGEKK